MISVKITRPRQRFADAGSQASMVAAVSRIGQDLSARMKQYPPQTLSPYRRTGKLGRAWPMNPVARRTGGRIEVRVANATSYAPYVQGERQARFMRPKGWKTVSEIADERLPAWRRELVKAVVAA